MRALELFLLHGTEVYFECNNKLYQTIDKKICIEVEKGVCDTIEEYRDLFKGLGLDFREVTAQWNNGYLLTFSERWSK